MPRSRRSLSDPKIPKPDKVPEESLSLSWSISASQRGQVDAWLRQHRHPKTYKGAIGGHITYSFTATGLGTVMTMSCAACKKKLDYSEYDQW